MVDTEGSEVHTSTLETPLKAEVRKAFFPPIKSDRDGRKAMFCSQNSRTRK